MEEIKKLVETWKAEKGSYIPNAPIYAMFIKELEDAIKRQEDSKKCDVCGSENTIGAPHMGGNCLDCNPL